MAQQDAIIAGGCFWCTEAIFKSLTGVIAIESGYTGGQTDNPTYQQVCSGKTGHAEAIRITFDPAVINYTDILAVNFATHDPTQLNRQGNDIGTQYRSAIFPINHEQYAEAEAAIALAQQAHSQPIVTTLEPFTDWYPAEAYHQDYWAGAGQQNGYCLAVIPAKLQKLQKKFADKLKSCPDTD